MLLSPCSLDWGDNATGKPEHSLLLVAGVGPEGHEPQRPGAAGPAGPGGWLQDLPSEQGAVWCSLPSPGLRIMSWFPLEAIPALGSTHTGGFRIRPVVNRFVISLSELLPWQVCNSIDAVLETKSRFFPEGRKFASGRKYWAVSNLSSGARGTQGIPGGKLSTVHLQHN